MPAHVVQVAWQELAEGLPLRYLSPPEAELRRAAREEGRQWVDHLQGEHSIELTSKERHEVVEAIERLHAEHWSAESVFPDNLDVEALVVPVNLWCRRGAQTKMTSRALPAGDGILDWAVADDGVRFTLGAPFLSAYVDARARGPSLPDDGCLLREIGPSDVVLVLRVVREHEGIGPVVVDLKDWNGFMQPITFRDLSDSVKELREKMDRAPGLYNVDEPSQDS